MCKDSWQFKFFVKLAHWYLHRIDPHWKPEEEPPPEPPKPIDPAEGGA